jgi:hypothetical protein
MGLVNRLVRAATMKRANEIEDIVAGLMINGVTKDEIEIQEHPDKTIIVVRGVPRYEVTAKFSVRDALFGG